MSDTHPHLKYTIHWQPAWWGGRETLILFGTGSSLKENELLIFQEDGSFCSISYARVRWMQVELRTDGR